MKFKQLKISGTGYKEIGNDDFWYSAEHPKVKQWLEEGNTPEPEFTEKEIEVQRIQVIKSKAAELISSKYPDYKQLNIIRIGGAELETMSAYIDSIREISNKAEQDGTKVEDVQWL